MDPLKLSARGRTDPLNPPCRGGEAVTTVSTAPANCPPETGWTRSEATEGVDDTNGLAELDERRRIKVNRRTKPVWV